jgi:hypothetical protein
MRERSADIAISTIDAFCLSLLREFPPRGESRSRLRDGRRDAGPRLMDEALDRALDIAAGCHRPTSTSGWCSQSSAKGEFATGWSR